MKGGTRGLAGWAALASLPCLVFVEATPARAAFVACTAAEIMAQEAACPNEPALPCSIRTTVTTPPDMDCRFDFGARSLVIGGSGLPAGAIQFGSRLVHLIAGSVTVHPNGLLEGLGGLGEEGGRLRIGTSGAVAILAQGSLQGRINVNGRNGGGWVSIRAGGTVTIAGRVEASRVFYEEDAPGGEIMVEAGQDIILSGVAAAIGGANSPGGRVDLQADGHVHASGLINTSGGEVPHVSISANDVDLGEVEAAALSTGGRGGVLTVFGRNVTLNGRVDLRGSDADLMIHADVGIAINRAILMDCESAGCGARYASFDVDGGDFILGPMARISATSRSAEATTSELYVQAPRNVVLNGEVDLSARHTGGDVEIYAGRDVEVTALIDVSSSLYGGEGGEGGGGSVRIEAGIEDYDGIYRGNLTISRRVDASGAGCFYGWEQIVGGEVTLSACDVTLTADAEVMACGGDGGPVSVTARRQLTVAGQVRAFATDPAGEDGTIEVTHSQFRPPAIAPNAFAPSPEFDETDDHEACIECPTLPPPPPRPEPIIEACSAEEIMAREPACPDDVLLPCNILSTVVEPPDAHVCSFDFGDRDVSIGSEGGPAGALIVSSRDTYIRAGNFTLHANGRIDASSLDLDSTSTFDPDNLLDFEFSGVVTLLGNIDLRSVTGYGSLYLHGSEVSISGRIDSSQICDWRQTWGAPEVEISSAGGITVDGELVEVLGAGNQGTGGFSFYAEQDVKIGGTVDIGGADGLGEGGAVLDVYARDFELTGVINGRARTVHGLGAEVVVEAENVLVGGTIDLRAVDFPGAAGTGRLYLNAERGSVRVNGTILADADPDQEIGFWDVSADASEDIVFGPAAILSVRAQAPWYDGLRFYAGRDVVVDGSVNFSGQDDPSLYLEAGRHVLIHGPIDGTADAPQNAADFSSIRIRAGVDGIGSVDVTSSIDTRKAGCPAESDECFGGEVVAVGCNLSVAAGAIVRSASIDLTARHQMRIEGDTDAGAGGEIVLRHPLALPPVIADEQVSPDPVVSSLPACVAFGGAPPFCLQPCPTCESGASEYPWICGDDELDCTLDSCGLDIGCLHEEIEGCVEPIHPTKTPTPIPPSSTPLPSRTPTPTPTSSYCPGDCDRNGAVSRAEHEKIVALIGRCYGAVYGCINLPDPEDQCPEADLDRDAVVRSSELSRILANLALYPNGCPPY